MNGDSLQDQFREHYPDGIDGDPDGIPTTTGGGAMSDEHTHDWLNERELADDEVRPSAWDERDEVEDVPQGCTGYRQEDGSILHDGDTCPVHEYDDRGDTFERRSAALIAALEVLNEMRDEYTSSSSALDVLVSDVRYATRKVCAAETAIAAIHSFLVTVKVYGLDQDERDFAGKILFPEKEEGIG